jgi:hypothetical protein
VIGHCFNPACNQELRYLRQGSVYQLETGVGRRYRSDFFWLCLNCSPRFEVGSDDNGLPLLTPRGSTGGANHRFSRIKRVLRGMLQECPAARFPCAASRNKGISRKDERSNT